MAENSNNDGGKAIQSNISCLSNELLVEILCRLGSSKHATQYYNGSSSHIGMCKGCLRIGQVDEINYDDDYPPKLNIWELNKHIQDWELVHELDFREFNLPELRLDEYFEGSSIVAFHPRDGDILYLSFVTNANSMTCLCNVRERTVEKIREGPKRDWSDIEVFPLEMSSWPTPIPLLSLSPGLQYQND